MCVKPRPLLQEWSDREPRSEHEAAIVAEFVPALGEAIDALGAAPTGAEAATELDGKLRPLEALAAEAAKPARGPDIELRHFAPSLCEIPATGGLPVPGTGQGAPPQSQS